MWDVLALICFGSACACMGAIAAAIYILQRPSSPEVQGDHRPPPGVTPLPPPDDDPEPTVGVDWVQMEEEIRPVRTTAEGSGIPAQAQRHARVPAAAR